MPQETLNTSAERAAGQASERRGRTAAENRRDREQAAAERIAQEATAQGAKEAWKGLNILANPEGSGTRQGKDWENAKVRAEKWRILADGKKLGDLLTKEGRKRRREINALKPDGFTKTFVDGGSIKDALQARRDKKEARSQVKEVKTGLTEMRADSDSVLHTAIEMEEARLIYEESQKKAQDFGDINLSPAEFARVRADAEKNVLASMEYQKMKRENARASVEEQSAYGDRRFKEAFADALAQEQSKKKGPLTDKEKNDVREQVIKELTDETVKIMEANEKVRESEDKAFMKDPEFADKLEAKLAQKGKTLQNATPEDARKAQAEAIEEMRKEKEQLEAQLRENKKKELVDRRTNPEWQQQWDAAYKKLYVDAVIVENADYTPELRQELEAKADKEIELQHAEREAKQAKAKLEIIDAKKKSLEARKAANDAKGKSEYNDLDTAATKAEDSFNTLNLSLRQRVTDLSKNIVADLQAFNDATELAKFSDDMRGKQESDLDDVKKSYQDASDAKAKTDLTVLTVKKAQELKSDTLDAEALTKDLSVDEVAAVSAVLQNRDQPRAVLDTFIANRRAKVGGLTSKDSLTIVLLKELFNTAKLVADF